MLDQRLETYLKVVEYKSYTKAAQELNLTQPAVSAHIKRLEEHYGVRLILTNGRRFVLTKEGEILYEYARLQQANEADLMISLAQTSPTIHIGATLSIADYYLPAYFAGYVNERKKAMSVTVQNTQVILDMLLKSELDCAFVEGIFDQSLFEHRAFENTRFVPVVRAGHPLTKGKVTREDLQQYPLILREKGSGTREIYENFLYQNNDSIQSSAKIYEIGSFVLIKTVLEHSDAISFMYEEVAAQEMKQGRLTTLKLDGFPISRPLHFIYLKNSLSRRISEAFYQELLGHGK